MTDRPLLIFPTPGIAGRTKKKMFLRSNIHYPTHNEQGQRLSPLFQTLQVAFDSRNIEIQQSAIGVDPEQVIVIEVIGSVDSFCNAIKKIDGLEWLGELDIDEITPDLNFYSEQNNENPLNGKLYLIMTNQRALVEMISLWNQFLENPEMKFQRGLTKFRDVFLCLKDIRRWGVNERLIETGVLQNWSENIQLDPIKPVRFEIELWYRSSIDKREEAQSTIEAFIINLGGQVLARTCVEGINYHAILGELPAIEIQNIISHQDCELVKCDGVMFFRTIGQFSNIDFHSDDFEDLSEELIEELSEKYKQIEYPTPNGYPIVAILDGVPLENHELLANRLIIDDPYSYSESYRAIEREHGTAMASLIIHGDLNDMEAPLSTPVYLRPIMKPNPLDFNSKRTEEIPSDVFVIDLIHSAVKRMFEGENGEPAVAPTVKIINLSIGDSSRLFDQTMSPFSRLLDWLSFKYNVLFIVSAGNHPSEIQLSISIDDFNLLSEIEIQNNVLKSIFKDARNRRLLSPAESINSLTVGALHSDTSNFVNYSDIVNPIVNSFLLSPVSAFGSGYRRSIKPDLVYFGGRQLYRKPMTRCDDNIKLSPVSYSRAPGNKVASTDDAGEINKTKFIRGTSNSAALMSRNSVICYESLRDVFDDQLIDFENNQYIPVLLKTMLVHGCTWGEAGDKLEELLKTEYNSHNIKSWISRWIGYGFPDINKVIECKQQRATIIGFGELVEEEAHIYKLPLPPSLSSQRIWRRLTITLSWITPVLCSNQKYRSASLWFEMDNKYLGVTREDADHNAVKRGTVQHEIFEGEDAIPYIDGDNLVIKINCRADANQFNIPIRYGLAVSLEVKSDIEIYEEVKARIATVIEIH